MTIDIVLLRKDQGGNPDLVVESEKRRFRPKETLEAVLSIDEEWRKGIESKK